MPIAAVFHAPVALAQADPFPGAPPPPSTYRVAPTPASPPDGKVAGLNAATFAALDAIRRANPGGFTLAETQRLLAAIAADGKTDSAERDLLDEMVQTQFRSISVTREGADPAAPPDPGTPRITLFTSSGAPRTAIIDVLDPRADLPALWSQGRDGWGGIVDEYGRDGARRAGALDFLVARMDDEWVKSNLGNGYKPLRDLLGRLNGFNAVLGGARGTAGRDLVYRAAAALDRQKRDALPDFLYNWMRPGGYLN